jgi:hypothetical protein
VIRLGADVFFEKFKVFTRRRCLKGSPRLVNADQLCGPGCNNAEYGILLPAGYVALWFDLHARMPLHAYADKVCVDAAANGPDETRDGNRLGSGRIEQLFVRQ